MNFLFKILRRIRFPALIFGILLGCAITAFLYIKLPRYTVKKGPDTQGATAVNLLKVENVTQSFRAEENGFSAVKVKLLVQPKELSNMNRIKFELFDEKGLVLSSQIIESSSIVDNQYVEFPISYIENSQGRLYSIKLSPVTAISKGGILLFSGTPNKHAVHFALNGRKAGGELVFDTVYKTNRLEALYNGRYQSSRLNAVISVSVIGIFLGSILLCSLLFHFEGNQSGLNRKV